MKITVNRYLSNNEATLGKLYLDDAFFSYCLEDQPQEVKVMDETRIPAGKYEIKLRNAGSISPKYAARYDFHKGMLWLQDVPDFEWVYIHTGNTDDHTSGCLLVGYTRNEDMFTIGSSRDAYSDLYQAVVDAAENNDLTIEYFDEDA